MYKISLEELQIFLEVAKQKSFSKAANALYISQPTITKWVKHLESQLDMELFDRGSRHVELTQAGSILLAELPRLQEEFLAITQRAREASAHKEKSIRIGALYGFNFEALLQTHIKSFEAAYPDVKIDLNIYNFSEMQEEAEGLDILLSTSYELEGLQGIRQSNIDKIDLYLAVSKQHPLAARESVTIEDIKDETFLIFSAQTSPTAVRHIKEAFGRRSISIDFLTVDNIPSQMLKISMNKGVAITNRYVVHGFEEKICLLRLADFDLSLYRVCAWRERQHSKALRNLCRQLCAQSES